MNVVSTRGNVAATPIDAAIAAGLADDGGLFVPTELPRLDPAAFDGRDTLPEVAATLLAPFFAGSTLEPELAAMCDEALSFPTPLVEITEHTAILELFHGPTAAFKDIGARFLAACFRRMRARDGVDRTILVATSGDTGGAVADAFFEQPGFDVVILYPDGRVSPRQAHLLSCYGGNVRTFRVAGAFDDCQRLVKQAFSDAGLRRKRAITSANSISLGRLLPQMAYYAHSALHNFRATGSSLDYVVPTGNLGNALACLWARAIGLPIGDVVLATNSNRVLPEHLAGAPYEPRESVATLANAMDVGDPSNFERLRWLWPDDQERRRQVTAHAVPDAKIRTRIAAFWQQHGIALCPHTATAAEIRDTVLGNDGRRWCIVATAHPAKFESAVEPIVGATVQPPSNLERLLALPAAAEELPPDYAALRDRLTAAT